ncbi:hypothetical protein DICPUDRAFT_156079 [Dictyostelium purpureum]|uniref:Methyltransferase domain-containing protein n=1 Tax=Dictyostelium purpureum TaxID=5786 RepID=F0ZVN1_DICPU|nr:uncharacterized protein DICPUDRAFT_156079 [Dictyostelium purpureum]EGC32019.1 hypothetical protein DICPUDRAFT_156079 [Dictyostelium purpureum]|eukprot:XP_003291475.1 hypothetical protein DICPUDRAFT_156079 [Dictyostelium purpureum]
MEVSTEHIYNNNNNNSNINNINSNECGSKTSNSAWEKIDQSESANKFIQYVDETSKHDQIIAHTRYSTRQLELKPGQKVMDCGCGAGKDLGRLESYVESHGQVIGMDISREMVECARSRMQHLPNVQVFLGDAACIPIESNYFDAIRCERLLQHVYNPDHIINEMTRVIKSGGRVVITDVDWLSSTVSIPKSIEEINKKIVNEVIFNQHPSIGLHLRGKMARNQNLENIEVFAQCLYTDSLAVADEFVWLGERGRMACAQKLITEEEYNLWRETIEKQDEEGSFVFTMNIFTVSASKK